MRGDPFKSQGFIDVREDVNNRGNNESVFIAKLNIIIAACIFGEVEQVGESLQKKHLLAG